MFGRFRNIHFIGIGGVGMSGIAEVLLNLGVNVTGSDIKSSDYTKRLENLGASVYIGHSAENVRAADAVVWSSAVEQDNVEMQEARRLKLPIIRRAEMLAELMRLKRGIAIAGTHGKTTTTSMMALILAEAGLDPTIVIGGKFNNIGAGAKLGKGEFMVAEADESDGSFMRLFPVYSIVTNIDSDHLDYYGTMDIVKNTFFSFIEKIPFYGLSVICIDDDNIRDILKYIKVRHLGYGFSDDADLRAVNYSADGFSNAFDVLYHEKKIGRIQLNIPGKHNVLNALATIGIALELEISFSTIKRALSQFGGAQRRFQIKSDARDILVVDDYAHHPTEIRATLQAAKSVAKKRVIAIFQPHRYTRVELLAEEFAKSFDAVDLLIITDIYSAGEQAIPGVSAELIIKYLKKHYKSKFEYLKTFDEIFNLVCKTAQPGDLIITLGAGNIWTLSERIAKNFVAETANKK